MSRTWYYETSDVIATTLTPICGICGKIATTRAANRHATEHFCDSELCASAALVRMPLDEHRPEFQPAESLTFRSGA